MRQAKENHWPQPLPSSDLLYADYYNQIHHLAHNIVCACCGCISHSINDHESLSVSDPALSVLAYAGFGCLWFDDKTKKKVGSGGDEKTEK